MTTFTDAPEVERLAKTLIANYHQHLLGLNIRYVFRDTVRKSNGKEILGTASKVTGRNAFFANPGALSSKGKEFFVIEIAEDKWVELNDAEKKALVDHELCHCGVEDDPQGGVKLVLKSHDVEEFEAIIKRHGLWSVSAREFAAAIDPQQLTILGDV